MPIIITGFASMRGFASHPSVFAGYAMEAPLWGESLALPDPFVILPVTTSLLILTNVELFGSMDAADVKQKDAQSDDSTPGAWAEKHKATIMRVAAFAGLPIVWKFPMGIFIFMSTNQLMLLLQNALMRQPFFERLFALPPLRREHVEEVAVVTRYEPRPQRRVVLKDTNE